MITRRAFWLGFNGFLLLLGCVCAIAFSRSPLIAQSASARTPQTSVEAGKRLYAGACLSCHGDAGIGRYGPALRGPRFTVNHVSRVISDGYPGSMMPPFKEALDPTEISQIAQYVQSVASQPAGDPWAAEKKPAASRTGATATPLPKGTRAFYTEAQAKRGHALFNGYCYMCHTVDRTPLDPATKRGMGMGPEKRLMAIVSDRPRWRRVVDVYNKVYYSMPADRNVQLTPEEATDIVAYLLKVNGAPSGPDALKPDVEAMRTMILDEPDFQPLFNGKDFTGIKFVMGCYEFARNPPGCAEGDTGPAGGFRVDAGTIRGTGKPQGYWYPDKKYLNFTLRFDYKFNPYPIEKDADYRGNSGYLVFIDRHIVWPPSIEIQGQPGNVLAILTGIAHSDKRQGIKFTVDSDARARVLKPLGQWNEIEIASKDGKIVSKLNGVVISTITEHGYTEPGYIGFQNEGSDVQWRNLRIREE